MILFKEVRVGGATQSPFSPQGIFYIPLLTLGYLFTSPFSPQGIFYISLLIPGYLLHSPSHPRVSFTFPFSSKDVIYIPLLTLACLSHPPSHPSMSFTSPLSLQGIFYIPFLTLLHSPSCPYVSFASPFLPLHIFYIPLLASTYLLHPPSHDALNQANLEMLSQCRQSITTKLFDSITCNSDHKLYKLLPPQNNCELNLRRKRKFNVPLAKTKRLMNTFIYSNCS